MLGKKTIPPPRAVDFQTKSPGVEKHAAQSSPPRLFTMGRTTEAEIMQKEVHQQLRVGRSRNSNSSVMNLPSAQQVA